MLLYQVFVGIDYFFNVLSTLILIYWVLRLFRPQFKLYYMLESFLAPILKPFRILNMKLMSRMRSGLMIDFSLWFALIALRVVRALSWQLFYLLAGVL